MKNIDIEAMIDGILSEIKKWYKEISGNSGSALQGYQVGVQVYTICAAFLTGGAMTAGKYSKLGTKFLEGVKTNRSPGDLVAAARGWVVNGLEDIPSKGKKAQINNQAIKCKILGNGCFVKNTPVLMAGNTFAKSGKTYALAAAMPFMAMPIQEVPLLSWTVAHETVNEQINFIASMDDDLYLGLLNEDPYTSDQQRQRDTYELNDTDWYSVSFEQVDGTSKCHFALHDEWIKRQGYETDKVIILNLPEQGINGPFRVTAIKHIIPQKKPEGDAGDGYDWKPVTGLFEHQSNQIYNINFDNGESLGVTYQHPIYSTTTGNWKMAGELEIGEEVLTKLGNTKVVSTTKKEGPETVYNLEVKELHNFLVGESGIVVHNACWDYAEKIVSGAISTAEIWEMKGFPAIFKRGGIIEQIIRKGKYTKGKGWGYTGVGEGGLGKTNFWLIDFFKGNRVVSLKSTTVKNGPDWATSNAQHIRDLSTRKIQGSFPNCKPGSNCINPSNVIDNVTEAELHIVVEKLSEINKNDWITAIKSKLPVGEKDNIIVTITEL